MGPGPQRRRYKRNPVSPYDGVPEEVGFSVARLEPAGAPRKAALNKNPLEDPPETQAG